jgi:hypothetical protein
MGIVSTSHQWLRFIEKRRDAGLKTTPPEYYPPPDKRIRPDIPLVTSKAIKRKWSGTLPDKYIATLTEQVSQTNVSKWVHDLSSFHTRHTKSDYIEQVANWLRKCFIEFGYSSIFMHEYNKEGFNLKNVVCNKAGSGSNGHTIIICGHYDSRMEQLENATARAPGADDNASGIAIILELARILRFVVLEDDVQFVAFSGEEQGLWGSMAYAQYVQDNNLNLVRLINIDMIGYSPPDNAIIIERDMGNVPQNNLPSQEFGDVMAQMAVDYTIMPVQLGSIYGSDYMPFEARGYVVVGAYEAGNNPNYHTSNDTSDTVDYSYVTDVARMVLGTVLWETASVINESSSPSDIYIRDNVSDTGDQPSPFPNWNSPDIWVRNNPPDVEGEDPGEGHQPPINGQPNYLYVQIHNRGSQTALDVTVKVYHSDPATGLIWPDHFQLMGEITSSDAILSGGSICVGPFIWTPHIVGHECLFAIASGMEDHAITDIYSGRLDHGLLVRYDNNVGQRNVAPQHSVPGGRSKATFIVYGDTIPSLNTITLDASAFPLDTHIETRIPEAFIRLANQVNGLSVSRSNSRWIYMKLLGGEIGTIQDFPLDAGEKGNVAVTIDFSYTAIHKQVFPFQATQLREGRIAGRYTIEITSIKETKDFVFGNPRSSELHTVECPFWDMISQKNKVPFERISEGIARGYNGCIFCLPEYNTG